MLTLWLRLDRPRAAEARLAAAAASRQPPIAVPNWHTLKRMQLIASSGRLGRMIRSTIHQAFTAAGRVVVRRHKRRHRRRQRAAAAATLRRPA